MDITIFSTRLRRFFGRGFPVSDVVAIAARARELASTRRYLTDTCVENGGTRLNGAEYQAALGV